MAVCIIGVAQETTRPPGPAPEPLDSWATLARRAAEDAGAPHAIGRLDGVHLVYCQTWQYDDAPARLCERLGIEAKDRYYSGIGGTTPQQLVNALAERMLAGELGLALVAGAEALATQRTAKQNGEQLDWSYPPDEKRPFPYEGLPDASEKAHELYHAWETFALWDNARRARLGVGMREYEHGIGAMMAPMTQVAASNPYAWRPRSRAADELAVATAENRYIGFPHTRSEVAVADVDMAAALLIATDEVADELGVPADKRIYLSGWAYALDPEVVSAREDMSRSVAMQLAFDAALSMADTTVADLAAFDLYSCFPSAVHFACDALGLDPLDPRGVTVTGGLPYAGGPSSCYVLHSIASMVERLRAEGGQGLVTGVGMHMTKHVAAVYSAARPSLTSPGDAAALQAAADAQPVRPVLGAVEAEGTVVAYTLTCDRENVPTRGIVVVDVSIGDLQGRALARVHEPELLAFMRDRELVGTTVTLTTDGTTNVASW